VHIRVVQSAWDRQMLLNPHALAIYLKLVHVFENRPKGSMNVNVRMMTFVFSRGFGSLAMNITIG